MDVQLAEPAPESAPKPAEKPHAPSATDARRVLVVDDKVDSAERMAVLLRLYGHNVRRAHDGEAALEAALAFRPDVIFLDIDLPKMDGYEVARRLRLEPAMRERGALATSRLLTALLMLSPSAPLKSHSVGGVRRSVVPVHDARISPRDEWRFVPSSR